MKAFADDGSRRCQALTKAKVQCSRKAEPNSNYCWQHQNYNGSVIPPQVNKIDTAISRIQPEIKVNSGLLQKSIQPGILSNILTTAGYSAGLNTITNTIVKNQLSDIIKSWLKNINVKTPVDLIPETQYPFLIQLYQSRVGDRPRSEQILDLAAQGFDAYIFYSKEHLLPQNEMSGTDINKIEERFDMMEDYEQNMNYFESLAKSVMDFKEIREGDTIRFLNRGIRNEYVLIWNGTKLESLFAERNEILDDDAGNLPIDIIIQNYPLVDYFRFTIAHNRIVWLRYTRNKLLDKIAGLIYKFETSDGYIVYSQFGHLPFGETISDFDYLTGDSLYAFEEHMERVFEDHESETKIEEIIAQVRADVIETLKTNRLVLRDSDFEVL